MGKRGLVSRIIATTKNQVLYPKDLAVLDERGLVIPKVGQPVLWVPNKNISIDASNLPNENVFELSIVTSQVIAGKKKKFLTSVNGTDWNICQDKFIVTNTVPKCACPQKVNMYFDCMDSYGEKGASIAIEYRDMFTQMMYGGDGTKQWQFNYAPPVTNDCGGCPNPMYSCWDYACGLADEINRYNSKDKEIEQVGRVNTGDSVYLPIKAAAVPYGRLLHKVCLSPGNTGCETCNTITGLVNLVVTKTKDDKGVALPTPVVTTIPLDQFTENNLTETEFVLLDIADYLEYELRKIGVFVNIAGGMGKCCQYEIEIGGCLDSAVLTTSTGVIPFMTEDPWINIPVESYCKPCGETNAPYSPKCLIRFYTESIEAQCNCLGLPAKNVNFDNFYKQIIDIHALEGFNQDKFEVHVVQNQSFPVNLGHTFINLIESRQALGGRGADMHEGGEYFGKFPETMSNHKFWDALFNIDCNTAYCSLNMVVRKGDDGHPVTNYLPATAEAETLLLIPITDADTFNSIKPIFDYLLANGRCNKITWMCFDPLIPASATLTGTQTVAVAGTTQFTAVVLPATAPQTGAWSSSDVTVATVSATGLVTGVAAGAAIITFTTTTGSVTATKTVTVS